MHRLLHNFAMPVQDSSKRHTDGFVQGLQPPNGTPLDQQSST